MQLTCRRRAREAGNAAQWASRVDCACRKRISAYDRCADVWGAVVTRVRPSRSNDVRRAMEGSRCEWGKNEMRSAQLLNETTIRLGAPVGLVSTQHSSPMSKANALPLVMRRIPTHRLASPRRTAALPRLD